MNLQGFHRRFGYGRSACRQAVTHLQPQRRAIQARSGPSNLPHQTTTATKATTLPPSTTDNAMARAQELCLALGITRHTSFRLVSSQPTLPVAVLASHADRLAKALSLQVEETALLASKEPALLAAPVEDVTAVMLQLCDIMGGITRTQASRVIVYSPALLALSPGTLRHQYEALKAALAGVDPTQLSALIHQQPYMITTPVGKVTQQLTHLAALLQLALPQAVQLLAAYPPLTLEKPDRLRRRLDELKAVLGAEMQEVIDAVCRFPPLLITHPDITAARLQLLADNLDVPRVALAPVLLTSPALFTVPQNLLVTQFSKLFAYFEPGSSKSDVLAMIVQSPALLGLQGISGR